MNPTTPTPARSPSSHPSLSKRESRCSVVFRCRRRCERADRSYSLEVSFWSGRPRRDHHMWVLSLRCSRLDKRNVTTLSSPDLPAAGSTREGSERRRGRCSEGRVPKFGSRHGPVPPPTSTTSEGSPVMQVVRRPPNPVPAKVVTEEPRPIKPSAHELTRTVSFGRSGSLSAASLLRPRNSTAVPTRAATPAAA